LVESLKGAFDSLSTKITTALTPPEDTKVPGKRTQESLLSDLGKKLDQLNTQVAELVDVQSRTAPDIRKTAKNTRNIG
jgi:peptidoglycan hydrolase CwlO-like protein